MQIFKSIAMLGLALAALPVMAQTPGTKGRLAASETRDANQATRIANGVENGQINSREAARLDTRTGHIDSREARLASDGNYSRRDFARVSYAQNRTGHGITRARFNRR